MTNPIRRPRPPDSADVSIVLAYLRELELYTTVIERELSAIKNRVEMIRADYPSDVFPGDTGKGARMAIDRVLALFALEARRQAELDDDPPF